MSITESRLRQIIREEATALREAPGEGPSISYRHPMIHYRRPGVSNVERKFADLIREMGAEEFTRELVRAIGDDERAESIARFMRR